MAASQPFSIFLKFRNNRYHPRDIGKHHIKFHDSIYYGLGDLRVNGRTHGRTDARTHARTDRRDSKVPLQCKLKWNKKHKFIFVYIFK